MLRATIERFGGAGEVTSHRVRDLSSGGVRIDLPLNLQVGATVLVSVGVLEAIGATVMWLKDGSAGLKFASQINPDDARARTAIAPNAFKGQARDFPASVPTAGWIRKIDNPYRK